MQITNMMNLEQLAERMGSVATQADAAVMRDLLVARFGGQDTSGIPEAEWLALLEQVPPTVVLHVSSETKIYAWDKSEDQVVYRLPYHRHGDGQEDTDDAPVWLVAEDQDLEHYDDLPDVTCD